LLGYEANGGQEHIFYLGSNTVNEQLLRSGTSWVHNDLISITPGGPPPPIMQGSLAGHDYPESKTFHVFYISNGFELIELYHGYDSGDWSINNLTVRTVGLAPLAQPGTPLVSYIFPADNTQHVIYLDQNNHWQELYYNGQWWRTDMGAR
jgi:hypothetical protein